MTTSKAMKFALWMTSLGLSSIAASSASVVFPTVPIETGTPYPAPNVRFILDDSGSMNLVALPDFLEDSNDLSDNNAVRPIDFTRVSDASHVNNLIYFNPALEYRPWMTATGARLANASYSAASRHTSLLTAPENLNFQTPTWFLPKVTGAVGGENADYIRYQIVSTNSANAAARLRVVRSEWLEATTPIVPAGFPQSGLSDVSTTFGLTNFRSWTVPPGIAVMTITLSGGTHGSDTDPTDGAGTGADLYVDDDAAVGDLPLCVSAATANVETCSFDNPAPGTWFSAIYRHSKYAGVTMTVTLREAGDPLTGVPNAGCSSNPTGPAWRNCRFANASATADAAVRQNFANWYHYHRSRMKVAKAGAAEAFGSLDINLRVAYDSINRGGAAPLDIPVQTDNGLFRGVNRAAWYATLFAEEGQGDTTLHRALQRAGHYYSDTTSAQSPYRESPSSDALACRQNFAILTSDGYWNSRVGYTPVGDADGTPGPTHAGSGGSYTYLVERPYQDDPALAVAHRTDTLADVAAHYWKSDLGPALVNNVPASVADPAFWQHMVTFGVSLGLHGTLNPSTDIEQIRLGTKAWPNTRPDVLEIDSATRVDDLVHAAVNGRGSFVVASNATEFASALSGALELIDSRTGSGASVSTNSTSTSSSNIVYQASYDSGRWSGRLEAFVVSAGAVASSPTWVATMPRWDLRKIFTWDSGLSRGAGFPTVAQIAALDRSSRNPRPVSGANNADYLRGNRALEAEPVGLRRRDGVLGDITNSSPFFDPHSSAVYVGANDGMLHAFDATSGMEIMSFVPSGVDLSALGNLSSPTYDHRFFVDGPIAVSPRSHSGESILIGTLGRGGKSVFALDVSNVRAFTANNVLWELSDADLGNVIAEPIFTKLQDGTPVVLLGNGVNSSSGRAVLFVVDVRTGAVLHKIFAGSASSNGLFAPRGWDDNGDELVDRVFASDLRGNVWKFDFSGTNPVVAISGDPLFAAVPGQPVTSGLALARNPLSGKLWIFFGSGSYLSTADTTDNSLQSVYGVMDDDDSLEKIDLQRRSISAATTIGGVLVRSFEATSTLPPGKSGWYVDLDIPASGERVVTRPFLLGRALIFASRVPPRADADPCAAGGTGYVNAIDAFSGTALADSPWHGPLHNGSALPATVGGNTVGSIDLNVAMPTQPTVIDGVLIVGGSNAELGWVPVVSPGVQPKRTSWREVPGQ